MYEPDKAGGEGLVLALLAALLGLAVVDRGLGGLVGAPLVIGSLLGGLVATFESHCSCWRVVEAVHQRAGKGNGIRGLVGGTATGRASFMGPCC